MKNKEHIKEYYEQNKEHIKEQQKIRNKNVYKQNNNIVECERGCFITYNNLPRHKQSNKHKKLFDK